MYNDVAALLEDLDYDDGSYGPVFVRLAWHAAGTYDKATNTGGSNGATMVRRAAGLVVAPRLPSTAVDAGPPIQ